MPEPGTVLRHSPLEHMAAQLAADVHGAAVVTLSEMRLVALVNLRGNVHDQRFRDAVRGALGIEAPQVPNTFARSAGLRCLWLGPDEWLVVREAGEVDPAALLRERLAGQHASALDVSAAYGALELRGARAREVLAKACSLDLHPRAFRAGQCAQSNFARTQAILALEDESPVFRLLVKRSFAGYLADWLLDAMSEYRRPA